MGRREDHHLPIVTAHLAARLGRPLRRVSERSDSGASHDLETDDGRVPVIAIEVKELVPGELLATRQAVARDRGMDSDRLTKRWTVLLREDPLSERLGAMPVYPDDPPPEEIERWAADGFSVVTKVDREDRWRRAHTLDRRPQVNVKNLARDIEPHLATLESLCIQTTGASPSDPASPIDAHRAVLARRAIIERTNHALCMSYDPVAGQEPGIDVHFGFGQVRTGRADVVAERVQRWLDSSHARNLVDSLSASRTDEGHAVLWLSTEAEADSAVEQGAAFCPAMPMSLPEGVDVLWLFVGPLVLRYDGTWTSTPVEPSADLNATHVEGRA